MRIADDAVRASSHPTALKSSIRTSYAHLPEAIAFTIHHHAKHLLHQMWEAEDFEEKMQQEMRLIKLGKA